MSALDTKAARLRALGYATEEILIDGTSRGVGVCRSCGRRVALVRMMYCPSCGSSLGVRETS